MTNTKLVALLGGAAAIAYLVTRGKTANAAPRTGVRDTAYRGGEVFQSPPGAFTLRSDPSGGKMCFGADGRQAPLSFCTDPASQLEGYFSTGASPCCSNCSRGLRCSG